MIFLFLFIVVLLLGFVFPRSRYVVCLQLIFITIVYGGYNGHIDLDNYIWQYENKWSTDLVVQRLYSYINNFFSDLGVPFWLFHILITFFCILLISICLFKLTDKVAYVLSVILLFVFCENGWQLKTMLATTFIVVALVWYKKKIYKQKLDLLNTIVYLLLVFIAIQFHFLAIFFVAFLLQKFLAKHFYKIIIIDFVFFIILRVALAFLVNYITPLVNYLNPVSIVTFVITVLWQVIGTSIVYYSVKTFQNNDIMCVLQDDESDWEYDNEFYLYGTRLLLLLLPLYFYANVATRIFRIWMIFMSVFMTKNIRCETTKDLAKILYDLFVIASFALWCIGIFLMQGQDPIFFDLIVNNIVF